jgi:hypothetical protein
MDGTFEGGETLLERVSVSDQCEQAQPEQGAEEYGTPPDQELHGLTASEPIARQHGKITVIGPTSLSVHFGHS